jgi:hypothetical protein
MPVQYVPRLRAKLPHLELPGSLCSLGALPPVRSFLVACKARPRLQATALPQWLGNFLGTSHPSSASCGIQQARSHHNAESWAVPYLSLQPHTWLSKNQTPPTVAKQTSTRLRRPFRPSPWLQQRHLSWLAYRPLRPKGPVAESNLVYVDQNKSPAQAIHSAPAHGPKAR